MDHEDINLRVASDNASSSPQGVVVDPSLSGTARKTDLDWLVIFPEAKKIHGPHILARLKMEALARGLAISLCSHEISKRRDALLEDTTIPLDTIDDELTKREIGILSVRQYHQEILSDVEHDIRRYHRIGKPRRAGELSSSDIEIARSVDIRKLIKTNSRGWAHCFNHTDKKTPNLHCKKSFAYCFACSKGWNPIDLLMARDGMKFRDAVQSLLSL